MDSTNPPLDPVEVRVLGSLMEKERTTPDNYPLTVNALTAACNQSSNRDPVMSLNEGDVVQALDGLTRRSLVRGVHRSDSRVRRYRHTLTEALHLHAEEAAVLCVLMLRGPQTSGEIRNRGGRLFEFRDIPHVEVTLQSLITLAEPLVAQLPRRPGHKEVRYAQLLGGVPSPEEWATGGGGEEDGDVQGGVASHTARGAGAARVDALEQEVAMLREELAGLRARLDAFEAQFQ
jgi:uncharacterized protein